MTTYIILPRSISRFKTLDRARIYWARIQANKPDREFRIYEVSGTIDPSTPSEEPTVKA